jgi:hypothetical protein
MLSAAAPRLLPLTHGPGATASQRLALEVLVTLVNGVREGLFAMPEPADTTWRPFQVSRLRAMLPRVKTICGLRNNCQMA